MKDPSYDLFKSFAQKTLNLEGGYQANPNDSGNFINGQLVGTKLGISAPTLQQWRKRPVTAEDMKALTKEEALDIYYNNYFKPSGAASVKDKRMAYMLFDTAIHSSVGTAGKLRKLSGDNYDNFVQIRKQYLEDLAEKKPKNRVFLEGWLNRIDNADKYARNLENKTQDKLATEQIDYSKNIPEAPTNIALDPHIKDTQVSNSTTNIQAQMPPVQLPSFDLESFKGVLSELDNQKKLNLKAEEMFNKSISDYETQVQQMKAQELAKAGAKSLQELETARKAAEQQRMDFVKNSLSSGKSKPLQAIPLDSSYLQDENLAPPQMSEFFNIPVKVEKKIKPLV